MSTSSDDSWTFKDYLIAAVVVCALIYFSGSDSGFGKKTCSYCDGEGLTECTTCYGEGHKDCNYCYGEGESNCKDCGGDGRITGYVGGDDGFRYVNVEGNYGHYQVMGGSVNVNCSKYDCDYGKVDCSNYSCDEGHIDCTWCSGSGEKICTYCSGSGER
jgi:hypothetical protein